MAAYLIPRRNQRATIKQTLATMVAGTHNLSTCVATFNLMVAHRSEATMSLQGGSGRVNVAEVVCLAILAPIALAGGT